MCGTTSNVQRFPAARINPGGGGTDERFRVSGTQMYSSNLLDLIPGRVNVFHLDDRTRVIAFSFDDRNRVNVFSLDDGTRVNAFIFNDRTRVNPFSLDDRTGERG